VGAEVWREDLDLAGLRDPDALAKLPPTERQECRTLWNDLDALLQRARSSKEVLGNLTIGVEASTFSAPPGWRRGRRRRVRCGPLGGPGAVAAFLVAGAA
jgi:hypothetical protein